MIPNSLEALVVHPPGDQRASDTVSLRTEAWDTEGDRVEQTIHNAYTLTDVPEGR